MITTKVSLQLVDQTVPAIIPVVQGDTGRSIIFEPSDFTIPEGATATYYIQKPSGEAVYNSAEITGNTVVCNLTAQSIIETGENNMQVRIILGEDIVTSFDAILMVRPFRGIGAVESETEINIFDKAVEQAEQEISDKADEIIAEKVPEIEALVEEVIESIPEDYTQLSNDVDDLKADISQLSPSNVQPNLSDFRPVYMKNPAVGSAISEQYSADTLLFMNVVVVKEGNEYIIRVKYDSTGTSSSNRYAAVTVDGIIAQLITIPTRVGETVDVTFTAEATGALVISVWNRYVDIKVLGEPIVNPSDEVADTQNANFLQDDFKTALMTVLAHIAWTDEHGEDYAAALATAMKAIKSISAALESEYTVYEDQSLYEIKGHLTVTINYEDGTTATTADYKLSGAIVAGTSEIVVEYNNFKTVLVLSVTAREALYRWDFTKSNVDTVEQETFTLGGNACLSAHGLIFHRNTVATSKSTNAVIPMGGRAKIHFGGINMLKGYTAGNGQIMSTPLPFFWRGNHNVNKYSFNYANAWHDTTLNGSEILENKDLILELEDDGTLNVYCGDELCFTADSVITSETTKYVSFGCDTSQVSLRFCEIESLVIYDAVGD